MLKRRGRIDYQGPFCTARPSLKLMELPCGHAPKGAYWKLSSSRAIDSPTFTRRFPLACDEYCRHAAPLYANCQLSILGSNNN